MDDLLDEAGVRMPVLGDMAVDADSSMPGVDGGKASKYERYGEVKDPAN